MKVFEGNLVGEGLKFAIVVSRFNSLVTEQRCWRGRSTHSGGTGSPRTRSTSSAARERSRSPP